MPISTRADVLSKLAEGKGIFAPCVSAAGVNASTAAAASGYITAQFRANSLTSTMPTTMDSWPMPPSQPTTTLLQSAGNITTNGSGGQFFGWAYRIGTLNLTATGDQFTHDAATFPVTRTIFGAATTAVPLIPLVQITTATATTAPVFRLRTAGGASGYTNQDNTGVIGTKTMTMPAAATVAGSTYFIRIEELDSAVLDINAIEVTTAGTTGAATIWGFELQATGHVHGVYETSGNDLLYGGLGFSDMAPAVATSGTATALYGELTLTSGTGTSSGILWGVRDT